MRRHEVLLGASGVALLIALVAASSTPGRAGLEEYSYTVQAAPQSSGDTYTYTTQTAAAPSAYTYTGTQPGSSTTTYAVQSGGDEPSEYTYSGNAPSDNGKLYTYTTVPQPAAPQTYSATPVDPPMTVINGYAQAPSANTEKWYTIPVGTLHPTDRAGDWQSGAFDSLNKDGTVAANAPLTLSGAPERPEYPQPTEARRGRRGVSAGAKLAAPGAARQQLLAQMGSAGGTALERVRNLPEAQRVAWARRVVAREERRTLLDTPVGAVRHLPPKVQRAWAEAVVRDAKRHRGRAPAPKKQWASHVLKVLGVKAPGGEHPSAAAPHRAAAPKPAVAAPAAAKRAPVAKPAAASAVHGHAAAGGRGGKGGVAVGKGDAFGMPSLDAALGDAAWTGLFGATGKGWLLNLRSGRGCGAECQRQARLSAQDAIATD